MAVGRYGLDTPARRDADVEQRPFLSRPPPGAANAGPARTTARVADGVNGVGVRLEARTGASRPLDVSDGRGLDRLIQATLQRTLAANPVAGRAADLRAVPMAIGRPIPTP